MLWRPPMLLPAAASRATLSPARNGPFIMRSTRFRRSVAGARTSFPASIGPAEDRMTQPVEADS